MIKFIENVKEELRNSVPEMDDAGIQEMIKQNMSREQVTGPMIRLNMRHISSPCTLLEVLDLHAKLED
jgi:predicted HAD superfamily phosphohydrolase YqeG